jgi:hypothetical protein
MKALKLNFLSALTAFFGVVIALILQRYVEDISAFLMPFSA